MWNFRTLALASSALAICAIPADAILFSGGAAGGGAGAAEITTLLLNNTSGGTVSSQQVSTLIPLGVSGMSAGNKLQIRKNDGVTVISNIQQDACATWKQNGNTKVCAISFVEPDSMTTGQTLTYQVWKTPGSPVTTPNVSTANITGNTNIVFKTSFNLVPSSGIGTAETGTWDLMDVNYVLNSCTQWNNSTGFGTDPQCGWEITATGGSKYGLHLFMYAKRESDNAIHKWIRTDMWVDFWGSGATPCPCSVYANVSEPNIYAAISGGTVGPVKETGYALGADLYNGATRIPVNFGGPNDSRSATVTFDSTYIDPFNAGATTGGVVFPGGAWTTTNFIARGLGVAFVSGGGTLPAAVTSNHPYFMDMSDREFSSNVEFALYNWQTGHQPNRDNIGPGGYTQVTTNGSGTLTGFPVVNVNSWGGTALAATNGGRIWIGAGGSAMTAPPVVAEEYFTYLSQTSYAVPPYITSLWGNFPAQSTMTANGTQLYYPNTGFLIGDYDTGGDNPGDVRIGQIDRFGAIALMAPFDTTAVGNTKAYAANYGNIRGSFLIDEHKGVIPVLNNGHNKANSIYPLMGQNNPTIYQGNSVAWFPVSDTGGGADWQGANQVNVWNAYAPLLEPSHMPMPAQAPYVLTGLPEYLQQMQTEADGMVSGSGTKVTLAATDYYRPLSPAVNEQTRGIAWGRRITEQADFFTPDTDVAAQYLSDLVTDDLGFDAAMVNTAGTFIGGVFAGGATSYERALGYLWADVRVNLGTNGGFQPWQDDYVWSVESLEHVRGEYVALTTTFINYFQAYVYGRMDATQGGCLWAGSYRVSNPFDNPTYGNSFDFTTLAPSWTDYYSKLTAIGSSFQGTMTGTTLSVSAYNSAHGGPGVYANDYKGTSGVGGSLIVGAGIPANTIASTSTPAGTNGSPYTVTGVGATTGLINMITEGQQQNGELNPAGSNPGAPPWAGCAANSLVSPLIRDTDGNTTLNSTAAGPNGLISIQAMSLGYSSWLGLSGATTAYNTVRGVQAAGTNPDTGGLALSFYTYTFGGATSSNPGFAIGPAGSVYPPP